MVQKREFFSPYSHGFVRLAVCVPKVRVADPRFNTAQTLSLAQRASDQGAVLALFPEMGLSAYSNEDLFQQDALLDATLDALSTIADASRNVAPVVVVGAPLRFEQKLFNCAVAIYRGEVLAVTPKSYLPNYREFYEKRQFSPAASALRDEVDLLGWRVPFGSNVVVQAANLPAFAFHMEICEDIWAPIPPSTYGALAGATVLLNLSASNITIGKADYRRSLAAAQSGRCVAAYLYSAAGEGESTTDLAWDGDALIYENGRQLAESERFSSQEQLVLGDVDLDALVQDRMRLTSFTDSVREHAERAAKVRVKTFELELPAGVSGLLRAVDRFPYVPSEPKKRDERCFEAYNIQVHGLVKRLTHAKIEKVVIGVSGGLDSTQSLIVAAQAFDRLGISRKNILAYTMPGFATSNRTLTNARELMRALGVSSGEIDIKPSCMQMFADIGHPFARGEAVYDVTFENVQAGERTSHLFRLANKNGALVVGTGDLSELALGWATYGVGDHMSHYNVNASVPKTLIQYLIRWVADTSRFDEATSAVLREILDTEISPELVPEGGAPRGASAVAASARPAGAAAGGGKQARASQERGRAGEQPAQSTEAHIGPYELQDFNLYYTTRHGFRPSKVAFLSYHAWHDASAGGWPEPMAAEKRHAYDLAGITHWLEVFLFRFFQISQFKRSAVPNGPKVGSGGSLSPRGDWRAPSDSEATVWLDELHANVPDAE